MQQIELSVVLTGFNRGQATYMVTYIILEFLNGHNIHYFPRNSKYEGECEAENSRAKKTALYILFTTARNAIH